MRIVLAIACPLALAACGADRSGTFEDADGETGSYSVDEEDGVTRAEIRTSDGTATMESGEKVAARLPDGFDIYPGAKVVNATNVAGRGQSGSLVTLESADPPDRLISYYRKQAEAAGIAIQMEMNTAQGMMLAGEGAGGTGFSFTASKTEAGTSATLMVGSDFD